MSPHFIAEPPLPVKTRSMTNHLWQTLRRTGYILWQVLVPFRSRPEEIDPLPDPTIEVTELHVKQCQWIFDQAEARRLYLEQKAQSTFGLMLFLVPLLASLFVFITGRAITSSTAIRTLLIAAAVLLLLGFISAVRAVGVKAMETLFLDSVVDQDGQFREYSTSRHARGLLYCASMNTAINDHIAQFVKGAHIFTATAVFIFLAAAVLASFAHSTSPPSPPIAARIVGPVELSSPNVNALRDDVANLKKQIEELNAKLSQIQKATPTTPSKQLKSLPQRGSSR
jgi:hypothetical protein